MDVTIAYQTHDSFDIQPVGSKFDVIHGIGIVFQFAFAPFHKYWFSFDICAICSNSILEYK